MTEIFDRGILAIFGICLVVAQGSSIPIVISIPIAITLSALCFYFTEQSKYKIIIVILYLAACLVLPELLFLLPLILYDCFLEKYYWAGAGGLLYLFYSIGQNPLPWWNQSSIHTNIEHREILLWFVYAVLACYLAFQTKHRKALEQELIDQRDSSTELNMVLKEKNKVLIESQDSQVHVATLTERNRIAREIHDNVGHMLSRCILQMGALLTIYKEEPLHEQLASVNDTLNQAMTSIRQSVHNLHDESIDLQNALEDIVKPMRDNYAVEYSYDMSDKVAKEIKLCFLSVLKEAMANIMKHSDARSISVVVREQPAFYQLSVEDDGSNSKNDSQDGMGLNNMRERVEALNGILRCGRLEDTTNRSGYKIFISIPKDRG